MTFMGQGVKAGISNIHEGVGVTVPLPQPFPCPYSICIADLHGYQSTVKREISAAACKVMRDRNFRQCRKCEKKMKGEI